MNSKDNKPYPDTKEHSYKLFQTGKYSSRLSDKAQSGFHESFRTSTLFFQQIIDSLEEYAVFTTDKTGKISSWNTGATRILGYDEKEIIGKNASILFTLEDRKKGEDEKELSIASKQGVASNERWHVRKDKSKFWGIGRVFPLYDTDKNLRGFTQIMRDLTDRKRSEEIEQRFKAIIENSSDGIRMIDETGTIIYASPSTKRILGYSEKEYLNQQVLDIVHPDDKKGYLSAMNEALKNPGKNVSFVYRMKHKDGKYRWIEGVGVNLLDNPAVGALVSNYRDITEKKDLESRKDEFVSMASHELKSPITSLNLFSDLLKRDIQNKKYENAINLVTKIKTQSSKLTQLVNDLLDVSRIETGKMRLRIDTFNLYELLKDIIEDLQYTTKHKIELKSKKDIKITADKYRIFQVVTNLVTNAKKYSPESKPINVTVKKLKRYLKISVTDKGIGIQRSEQEKIFEKLYQVGDSKEKTFPGLGMGLYISKEIVIRHGGTMWVESQKGKGSTFNFTLPLVSSEEK